MMKEIFIIIAASATAVLLLTGVGFLGWSLAENGQIGIEEFKIVLIGVCKGYAISLSFILSVFLFKMLFDFVTKILNK